MSLIYKSVRVAEKFPEQKTYISLFSTTVILNIFFFHSYLDGTGNDRSKCTHKHMLKIRYFFYVNHSWNCRNRKYSMSNLN